MNTMRQLEEELKTTETGRVFHEEAEPKVKKVNKESITMWEDIDKEEIAKAVMLLDLFTKTFCRYKNDYERFEDLKFRCDECTFQEEHSGKCLVKLFKSKYAPDYQDFGSMGDL